MTDNIDVLDDQAIYQRTRVGQQELVGPGRDVSRIELKLLAMVTGLTPVRVLLDMGIDATDAQLAFSRLLKLGLVEQVMPAGRPAGD